MTTNQTIDGVHRDTLDRALNGCGLEKTEALKELRALLDAHTNPYGFCHSHTQQDTGSAYCPDCGDAWKKWYAAQPQGEPVAWEDSLLNEMSRRFGLKKYDNEHLVIDDTQVGVEFAIEWFKKLYAEQPAPVACLQHRGEPCQCEGVKP